MSQRNRIAIATDFSASADRALEWAARVAQHRQAELHLVHAMLAPQLAPVAGGYVNVEAVDAERSRQASQLLRAQAATFGVTTAEVVRGEDLALDIQRRAEAVAAQLLVVGVPRGQERTHALLGSVGERLIRTSPLPVVAVPEVRRTESHGSVRRVLVPTDLGPTADLALGQLTAILERVGNDETEIHLLHVLDLPSYVLQNASLVEGFRRSLLEDLKALACRHRAPQWRAHVELTVGSAAEEITARARALSADLIALPSHGRTGVARFFLGSVAERVARAGVCPTLTFHPDLQKCETSVVDQQHGAPS